MLRLSQEKNKKPPGSYIPRRFLSDMITRFYNTINKCSELQAPVQIPIKSSAQTKGEDSSDIG